MGLCAVIGSGVGRLNASMIAGASCSFLLCTHTLKSQKQHERSECKNTFRGNKKQQPFTFQKTLEDGLKCFDIIIAA